MKTKELKFEMKDLENISMIENEKTKQKATKDAAKFNLNVAKQQVKQKELKEINSILDTIFVKNKSDFKYKNQLTKQKSKCEKSILYLNSKISKYKFKLILEHNIRGTRPTAQEFYKVVNSYEQGKFFSNHLPPLKLLAIANTNAKLNISILELEFFNLIKHEKLIAIPKKWIQKNKIDKKITAVEKNIQELREKIAYLNQSSVDIRQARFIKKLDKLAHKKYKGEVINVDEKYSIELIDVSKYYYNKYLSTKVLKNIDLKIKKGEFVVVLGPSGSGKTTLLNIISGMDTATYGKTIVAGTNLINKTTDQLTKFRKNNVGYIFQQYGLLPNLSVRENVEIGWNLQDDKSKRLDIDELLKTVGMYEHRNKFPHELSGGQQQRISVARSMAKNPNILFGDEPTGAIDEEMSKQILKLFVDINERYKTTVIIVTHNPIFEDLAQRVIKVKNGIIAQDYINKKRKTVDQLNWSI